MAMSTKERDQEKASLKEQLLFIAGVPTSGEDVKVQRRWKAALKYVKLVEKLDKFFSFPWGRGAFELCWGQASHTYGAGAYDVLLENNPKLTVLPTVEVGEDRDDGWGVFDCEILERKVMHGGPLESGAQVREEEWGGGDA
ncbi:hypothetical protein Bca52824_053629 [Brassica carinata]|uniref:DUF1985 domain-containing protein n=1 Tax=Brassica carinata TaxID=52824 RepID=A0A8X7R4I6_BRACI|nr:hypothetical protein Bca52824_053629 [Brassica carinata]